MQNRSKKRSGLGIVTVFASTAVMTVILIIAGAYLAQKFSGAEKQNLPEVTSEEVVKNNEKTASMEYSGRVTVDTADNSIKLYFKNPSRSSKSMALEGVMEVDGENVVLFKTEKLYPGDKVEEAEYKLDRSIEVGKYKGKFVIHFYNDSGDEEIVNSEIMINIYVK